MRANNYVSARTQFVRVKAELNPCTVLCWEELGATSDGGEEFLTRFQMTSVRHQMDWSEINFEAKPKPKFTAEGRVA
jgi:hypothetical protein